MTFLSSLDDLRTIRRCAFGAASALVFQAAEPGEGQRWSTWPATIPTERGPEPRPDWLVTSAAAIDTELGVVKTGKEADLAPHRACDPGCPGRRAGQPRAARRQAVPHERALGLPPLRDLHRGPRTAPHP